VALMSCSWRAGRPAARKSIFMSVLSGQGVAPAVAGRGRSWIDAWNFREHALF
jgi:hypothetical protein